MIEYVCNWCNKSSLETSDRVSSFSWAKMWCIIEPQKDMAPSCEGFQLFHLLQNACSCFSSFINFPFHFDTLPIWNSWKRRVYDWKLPFVFRFFSTQDSKKANRQWMLLVLEREGVDGLENQFPPHGPLTPFVDPLTWLNVRDIDQFNSHLTWPPSWWPSR